MNPVAHGISWSGRTVTANRPHRAVNPPPTMPTNDVLRMMSVVCQVWPVPNVARIP